ncbi:hypothetical protein ACP43V_01665 [Vibrio genomosp. F10 str. 9ZC157]|uniref:Uncharacterized protein n=1 Tax=Vibrio genomosp. F10 str. ZF-129 TaxID=1187848 RepID=A0A1E5BCU7_9VIBR|nr:hypothetical protein [Vibrio genomosp. F10]OEE32323.1 hypothetical protein A1QO_11425 [Vibrio genomosp. F10 str. ZF-129]OEE98137.1 hypothetical protein A1QM_12985 [Vibrio genomosp. F10 str. 9ZC157]
MYTVEQFVDRITTINRAWKIAQQDENLVIKNQLSERLKLQKANWQLEFLRAYPNKVWLKPDHEIEASEEVYSVRFGDETVLTSDGDAKWNAEHLPARIAKEHLTEVELTRALHPKY